jgi:outer membrane protein W
MSKFKAYIFLLAIIAIPLQMKAEQCCEAICSDSYYCTIEGRASAYFPFNNKVRRIYSSTWGFYEGEINIPLWCGFDGYFSAGYLENTGSSLGLRNKTKLQMVPLTLGLKYFYEITPSFDLYLGVGAVYSILNIRDHSPYVHQHISKNSAGVTAKLGGVYFFWNNWFVDASVDYIYQNFRFKHSHSEEHYVERHNLDMSGIKVGAGIGLAF